MAKSRYGYAKNVVASDTIEPPRKKPVHRATEDEKWARRVTTALAVEQHRCICEGCRICRGVSGFPCGRANLTPEQTKCNACSRIWA